MSSFRLQGAALLLLLAAALSTPSVQAADASENRRTIDSVLTSSFDLNDKVVYVDFWATWCPPCRRSFPWMRELSLKYRARGLEVVTVSLDERPALATKFMEEMQVAFPAVFDTSGSLAKLFDLEVMPTSFLYGRDGTLRLRHEGFEPKDGPTLDSLINALLEEKPKE